jgi:putative ABC transport system ATP-binding protein
VLIDGRDVSRLPDRRRSAVRAGRIGFVFDRSLLDARRRVLDSVADGLLYAGVPRGERRRRAEQALVRVGLDDRIGRRPHELSAAERRRVAFARAVVGGPELLLADEPAGGLDSCARAGLMRLLRQVHAAGATVVVATHDPEIAASLPRRVVLRDGQVVADVRDAAPPNAAPPNADSANAAPAGAGSAAGDPASPTPWEAWEVWDAQREAQQVRDAQQAQDVQQARQAQDVWAP